MLLLTVLPGQAAVGQAAGLKIAFGPGEAQPGHTRVTPQTTDDAKRGYGLRPGAAAPGRKRTFAC